MKRTVLLAFGLAAPLIAPVALAAPAGLLAESAKSATQTAETPKGDLYATFETSAGKIGVKLLPEEAPKGVENFVALATGKKEWTDPRTGKKSSKPLYDGTVFHRVIPGFMIQGGDPLGNGTGDPGYRFEDEIKSGSRPFAEPCQLAYANSGPNTNGSQIFITEVTTPHLNPRPCRESPTGVCGYVRFGSGVCGCELVKEIALAGNSKTTLKRVVVSTKPPTCK